MTRDEIVNFVCGKIGQIDATSLAFCGDAVNRRYQMIYDADDWLDAMKWFLVTPVAGQQGYDVPAALERVTKIVQGANTIEPVNVQFLFDVYPGLLAGQGTPRYYIERKDDAANKFFVYPAPDASANQFMLVYGKKVFAPLGASDTPILRNIDNCLIAFVQGDMLQRQRQYAKSQALEQQASSLLEQMRAIEKQRANRPRMSSQITVGGDSLAEMTDAVAARIRDYTVESRILIQEFLRRNYLELYDAQLWPESVIVMQVDRDGSEIILPEYVDRVLSVRSNPGLPALPASEVVYYFQANPQIFEQSGSPVGFTPLASAGVAVLPPKNEELVFTSTDDGDVSQVYIMGETAGVEVSETITLNGTLPVISKYPYDTPITIAKSLTTGTVTVTGFVSQIFLVQLLPEERERKHIRVWLQPTPTDQDGQTCLLLGKRRIKPLVTDEATPILRGLGTTLINMTTADMFDQLGNPDAATSARAKAQQSIQTVVDRELKQTAYEPQIIPYTEPCPLSIY